MNEPSPPEFHYGSTVVSDVPANEQTTDADGSAELTGSGLAAEKARRLDRVAELRSSGVNPYPYRFDRTHTLAEEIGRAHV